MANQIEAQHHMESGNAFYEDGKYTEACEEYQKANRIDSNYLDAVAWKNWGIALYYLKKYQEAVEKFKKAIEKDPKFVRAYYDLGLALRYLKVYDKAVENYRKAKSIDPDDVYAAYASQALAVLLWKLGKYKEGWNEWEETYDTYERIRQNANQPKEPKEAAKYYQNFGSVLHEVFRDFKGAEDMYSEGLKFDPDNIDILIGQLNLYLEIRDENVNEETTAYWKAWEVYKKTVGILKDKAESAYTLLKLGKLYLIMEDYKEAESYLLKVLDNDKESAETYTNLGILYMLKEDFKQAVQYFKDAVRLDPDSLTRRSSLAKADLKMNLNDKAEAEYKKILRITPYHVESHIGLGEVYTAMGDDGDEDMYDNAIYHFTEGIKISNNKTGSKILKKKEMADTLYSRGYASVKLYETSKTIKDESRLQNAKEDFKNSFKYDPDHHKAKRAKEKIDNRLGYLTPQRIQTFGQWWIFSLSIFVFLINQSIFLIGKPFIIYGKPIDLDVGNYILLTSGSIIFMIIGLYLPQILKLKVGNIELEKSPVQQITTSFGLSRQP